MKNEIYLPKAMEIKTAIKTKINFMVLLRSDKWYVTLLEFFSLQNEQNEKKIYIEYRC